MRFLERCDFQPPLFYWSKISQHKKMVITNTVYMVDKKKEKGGLHEFKKH